MTTPRTAPARARCGFTLVELLVVLVLLGLTAGLVAMSLRLPPTPVRGERDRVVSMARSTALRRAQVLELRVDAGGSWWLRPEPDSDSATVATGHIPGGAPALRLRIDALGTCIPRTSVAWDAMRCVEVAGR